MEQISLSALSLLRGPDGETLHVVNKSLSAKPTFLCIPEVAGGSLLPLRRIKSSVIDDEDDYWCWTLCSLTHERFVFIGEDMCYELTKSEGPLHTRLDIVLCFLIDAKINLKSPASVI